MKPYNYPAIMIMPKKTTVSDIRVNKLISFIFFLPIFFMLTSCATELPKTDPVEDFDSFVGGNAKETIEVPKAVDDALLRGPTASSSVQKESLKRFDISVNSVPAKVFFVSLVSEAGVNVVAHPDIEGSISLDLKDVSVPEVLSVIRDVYGYEFKFQSGIYTIYPRKLRTEIFEIDYLDVKRVGITDTSVLIGNINSSSGSQSNGNSSSSSQQSDAANLLGHAGGETGENSSNSGSSFTPGARVQTLNATNFWEFLEASLSSMIGGDEDGRFVMTNAQAGMVVVRALPYELATVREFLEKSELSIQRQVILETKILEVQLNEQHESGINWGAIGGELTGTYEDSEIDSSSFINDGSGLIESYERVSQSVFSSVLGVSDITKLINLLDRQGDVSVLSSPRISTVNNQKAVIRVGSDEFFVTGISNSTTASAASVTNTPQVELSSFFSGISLDVTPQIADDGDVILHVHPIVSEVTDQLKEIQVGDDNFELPLALRDVRESDSIVRASSGEVVVLGGLMQESSSSVDTKRSRLGNVPILNILFKHEAKSLQKTELVILMRPIVVEDKTWGEQVRMNRSRLEGFNGN